MALNVFIHQFDEEKQEERVITAASTEFRRNEHGVVLVMSRGSIQTRPKDSLNMRGANFDEYVMPIDMQGTAACPSAAGAGCSKCLGWTSSGSGAADVADPQRLAEWTSEAAKRTGIPILALVHTLFGIALVLTVSSATGRGSSATTLTVLAVPAVHIAILIAAETLTRKDPRLIWAVAAAIAVELMAALVMLQRQNAVRTRSPERVKEDQGGDQLPHDLDRLASPPPQP